MLLASRIVRWALLLRKMLYLVSTRLPNYAASCLRSRDLYTVMVTLDTASG